MADISNIDHNACCGCNACAQRCPKQCISMHEDGEGFLYPEVNREACVDCGLCEKVCPVLNRNEPRKPRLVFAARNRNEAERLRSSSGGIFVLLAKETVGQGGVVFGARFSKNWEVEHCHAETLDELEPLMRSKYVQSRIGNTYREAEVFLKQGRKVLFVGAPCQIAGLRKFLRRDYENLLTMDFVCHGVPSPGVWRAYLKEITENAAPCAAAGKNTVLTSSLKSMPVITGVNFREKQNGGYSWQKYGFVVRGESPSKGDKNSVLLSDRFSDNPFMKAFLRDLTLRPSCYNCTAKNGRSGSDLTIGDFWGIEHCHPELDDNRGTGVVFVHTDTGAKALEKLDVETTEVSYDAATKHNPAYIRPVAEPKERKRFWKKYDKGKGLKNAYEYAILPPLTIRIKMAIYGIAMRILNKQR